MKKTTFVLVLCLIFTGLTAQTTTEPETFKVTIPMVTAVAVGIYEVISRVVPTSKTWSIIGKVLEALSFLSNSLDRRK